jgi:ferredoxin-NADP reductase
MVKYLIDTKQKRDIVLLYSNKKPEDIAYKDIFDAAQTLGVETLYNLTDVTAIPIDWQGPRGFLTGEMIKKEIPDYMDRKFYISGPHVMVSAYEKMLTDMGVKNSQIKTDFFPGFV